MSSILDTLSNLAGQTGFLNLSVGNYIMIAVACLFLYLRKQQHQRAESRSHLLYPERSSRSSLK